MFVDIIIESFLARCGGYIGTGTIPTWRQVRNTMIKSRDGGYTSTALILDQRMAENWGERNKKHQEVDRTYKSFFLRPDAKRLADKDCTCFIASTYINSFSTFTPTHHVFMKLRDTLFAF